MNQTIDDRAHRVSTRNLNQVVILSEQYGIPQARHRVILLGIRNDLKKKPTSLKKHQDKINIEEVINDLPRLRSGLSKLEDTYYKGPWHAFYSATSIESSKKHSYTEEQKKQRNYKDIYTNFYKNNDTGNEIEILKECRR